MSYKIIIDSCGELTEEMKKSGGTAGRARQRPDSR